MSTSQSSTRTHTLLILSDMLLARPSTDFLCVHSSRISPISRRNMTDPAVAKSFVRMDAVIAVASRTGTSSFLFARHLSPLPIYLKALTDVRQYLSGIGTIHFLVMYQAVFQNSLSSYCLFMTLPDVSVRSAGTSTLSYPNCLSTSITSARSPSYIMIASQVLSCTLTSSTASQFSR